MLEKLKRKLKMWAIFGVFLLVACTGVSKVVTVSNTVNGKELPIYSVETEEKKVALSFDAAWGNEDTQQILDILAQYNVRTTFFMTGEWVEKYPEDVKKIYEAKKFINLDKYLVKVSIMFVVFGLIMLTSGILSFIIDKDFVFACIFTATLVIYFISDHILSKKSIIKG